MHSITTGLVAGVGEGGGMSAGAVTSIPGLASTLALPQANAGLPDRM
jgi:hypothetical protein